MDALVGPVTAGSTVVYVAGFVALLLVVFTGTWAASIVTVAHEGGHVVVALLSGRKPAGFVVNETTGGGETRFEGLGANGSDADQLARCTWIPAVVWVALFWFVAVVCLWVGGRRLIGA